jgi:ABC-2 type transport system permease protein
VSLLSGTLSSESGAGPSRERHPDLSKILAISAINRKRAVGDHRVLFVAAALPIMLILVIGFVSGRSARAPLGIVENDHGPIALRLVSILDQSPSVQVHIESSPASERDAVLRGTLLGALVVPSDFDATVRAGSSADLQVLGRVGNTGATQAQVAVSAAYGVLVAEWASAERLATASGVSEIRAFASVENTTNAASRTAASKYEGNQPGPYSYTTAANLVLFVFLTLLVTSSGLVETRRTGLLRRMLVSPTPARVVVLGQLVSATVIGLMQAVGLLVVGTLVFGVKWGDPFGVLLLVVVLAIAASGASVLLGTVARSQEQAVAVGIVAAVAFGMLGGCMWPLDNVGPLMRNVGHISPQAWAMDGFVRLIFGHSGIVGVLPDVGVLALFAVALVAIATNRLRAVAITAGTAL